MWRVENDVEKYKKKDSENDFSTIGGFLHHAVR